VFSLFFAACSSGLNFYVRKGSEQRAIRKVAVFTFHNNTNVPEASEVVTAAFIAQLVEGGKFKIEFSGNVKSFLVSERIVVRTGVDLDTIKLMGKKMNVDAVFLGQVEEYVGGDKDRAAVVPVVSISSRLVDTKSGKIVFMAQHRRTGDDYISILDFGKIRSVGELTKKVVGEIVEAVP
jgi:TolB-like protein